jgi:hypothetical protein
MDDIVVTGHARPYHAQHCHTMLCEDCLTDSIAHKINNGDVDSIKCPSCHYYILPREINERCAPKEREQYHLFQLRKLLSKQPNVHQCTNPCCENAVIVEDECALKDWECEACAVTCSFCKGPAHTRGAKCAASRNFRKAEAKHKVWVALSISKRCPSCRTPIIKKGGCPHM